MANTRDVNVSFKIDGADSSKVDIEKVKTALDETKASGTEAANTITQSFSNIENRAQSLSDKITAGRMVTVRDAVAINQQFILLENTLRETFGSISQAPDAIQTAFARAQQTVNATTDTVRNMSVSAKFLRQDINEAGGAWLGFENAIARAAGAQGKYVASFFLITKAWEEGWNIGMKLNKLFGTDMQVWEQAAVVWGQKLGAVVKALAELIANEGIWLWDLLHGRWTEAQRDSLDVADSYHKLGAVISEVANTDADAWQRAHPPFEQWLKDRAEAAKAQEALKQKTQELIDKIKEETQAEKDNTAELNKQKIAQEDADLGIHRTTDEVGYLKRGLDSATTALEAQKTKVAELTREFGASNPMTEQAVAEQKSLEQHVTSSKDGYDKATAALKDYESKQKAAQSAIESVTPKIADNKVAIHENVDAVIKNYEALGILKKSHEDDTEATRESTAATGEAGQKAGTYGRALDAVVGSIHLTRDEHGKMKAVMVEATDATKNVTAATDDEGKKLDETTPKVTAWKTATDQVHASLEITVTATRSLASEIAVLRQQLDGATGSADALVGKLNELKIASDQAAGDFTPGGGTFSGTGTTGGWGPDPGLGSGGAPAGPTGSPGG